MSDPRVMKLMQDERVMKAVMAAMSMPGQGAERSPESRSRTSRKAMALATEDEVKDLQRTVRKLEEEVCAPQGATSRRRRSASGCERRERGRRPRLGSGGALRRASSSRAATS